MDRPASVTAAILGVVLIGITIPYFAFGGADEGSNEYLITWSEDDAATGSLPVGTGGGQTMSFPAAVQNHLVSNITIEVAGCADSAQAPVQQDAVLTFTLMLDNETVMAADGQPITRDDVTCDNAGPFQYPISGHPDVGSVRADNDSEARGKAFASADNTTGTYVLQFSWARPSGQVPNLPIPVGQPVFSGSVTLDIQSWRATANLAGQEGPR